MMMMSRSGTLSSNLLRNLRSIWVVSKILVLVPTM